MVPIFETTLAARPVLQPGAGPARKLDILLLYPVSAKGKAIGIGLELCLVSQQREPVLRLNRAGENRTLV
jgi:hypothetical protein